MSEQSTGPGGFFQRLSVRAKRAALRRTLIALRDRQLADMGFSRALLEDGVRAWPWRTSEESVPVAIRASRVPIVKIRARFEDRRSSGIAAGAEEAA